MEAIGMIKLVFDSRVENIPLIGGAVRGIAGSLSLDETGCYHLELCVVEAVTNVMKHAYHGQAGHCVEVEILRYRDRITFKIHDTGACMHPAKAALPEFDPEDLKTVPEHGMGRFIMEALMDEVRYDTVNGRNTLTLTKFFKRYNEDEHAI